MQVGRTVIVMDVLIDIYIPVQLDTITKKITQAA
jgi:hypothetical protein